MRRLTKKWCFSLIVTSNPGSRPPRDWWKLIKVIKEHGLVDNSILSKIEVAAFTIRGSRTLRWKMPNYDPQYATIHQSVNVAKKLLAEYLNLYDFNQEIPKEIKSQLVDFNRLPKPTVCPLCKDRLKKSLFELDGRKDSQSIQMGHIKPLNSRGKISHHFAKNVNWQHRQCNYMQGERELKTALKFMKSILIKHGKI